MVVCPYCGKENNQPDAAYCLYCGSSLKQQQPQGFASASQTPMAGRGYGMSGGMSSPEISERYQRAFARVEQLGNVVIALAVITLVLVLI